MRSRSRFEAIWLGARRDRNPQSVRQAGYPGDEAQFPKGEALPNPGNRLTGHKR